MEEYNDLEMKEDQYINYINEHISNIKCAMINYGDKLCELLNLDSNKLMELIYIHDKSKYDIEEFIAYRMKFYPSTSDTKSKEDVDELFNLAWLHHQNNNPHHPEYWVLIDDGKVKALDMPNIYIAEMLLDWEAMSMKFHDNTYKYYYEKGKNKILSDKTRATIESVIDIFK